MCLKNTFVNRLDWRRGFLLMLLFLLIASFPKAQRTVLIRSVRIVDGTGAPAYIGSVRIKDSVLVAVGDLIPTASDSVIEGRGLVLAPGFIDTHSHHYGELEEDPSSLPTNSQGITTIVTGQDGSGDFIDSIKAFIKRRPVSVNIATYTGHSTLRELTMGTDLLRPATSKEIEKMAGMLMREMSKGSLGLSTGLEYEEAFYSSRAEVLQLSKMAAARGGRYISHIRSEDITLDSAIEEVLTIGRVTHMPVQISHIKIGLKEKWGRATSILQRLEKARREGIDVTADVYPYDFWNSTMRVLFPKRDYEDPVSAEFAVRQLFDPSRSVLVRYAPIPGYVGKTFSEVSVSRQQTESKTLMELVAEASRFKMAHPDYPYSVEAIAAKAMWEEDVHQFVGWPQANICSDGRSGGHPRGFGAFTKVLRVYVRERKQLSLEEAIHKMTLMGATHVGLKNRGSIRPGYYADLVLFDPATVSDHSDLSDPKAISTGIEMVWINGRLTYQVSKTTDQRPGVFIER
ncbi:MAG: N-acyl-D-amino-acid deacylase family protein [Bacteroidota bacterium]